MTVLLIQSHEIYPINSITINDLLVRYVSAFIIHLSSFTNLMEYNIWTVLTILVHLALVLHEEVHEFPVCALHVPHPVTFRDAIHHPGHTVGVLIHVVVAHA